MTALKFTVIALSFVAGAGLAASSIVSIPYAIAPLGVPVLTTLAVVGMGAMLAAFVLYLCE